MLRIIEISDVIIQKRLNAINHIKKIFSMAFLCISDINLLITKVLQNNLTLIITNS